MSKPRFIDMFDWVLDLTEAFDSKIPVDEWKMIHDEVGNQIYEGILKIKDETFKIIIEPVTIQGKSVVNLVFEKLVDGKFSQDLVFNSINASRIIGAVIHGAFDKLSNFDDVDFVVFCASTHVDKRMGVYNNIARCLMKLSDFTIIKSDFKVNNGLMTIISKKHWSDEMLKELEKLQK